MKSRLLTTMSSDKVRGGNVDFARIDSQKDVALYFLGLAGKLFTVCYYPMPKLLIRPSTQ